MSKVSVVTGANKGIGYGIVRGLCKQVGGTVILTSRSTERGLEAVKELENEGLAVKFEQLDITDEDSVKCFVEAVKSNYGGIDILCNNAGIAYKRASTAPALEQAKITGKTNFLSTVKFTETMLPFMKKDGRICQVSSRAGLLSWCFPDTENAIRKSLLDPELSEEDLFKIYADYIAAVENEDYSLFPANSAYSMSKCLLTTHGRVFARRLKDDPRNILINSCCPGFVNTDMTSGKGYLSIDEGAKTPLFLCQLPNGSPAGKFYVDEAIYDWENMTKFSLMIQALYPTTLFRLIGRTVQRWFSS